MVECFLKMKPLLEAYLEPTMNSEFNCQIKKVKIEHTLLDTFVPSVLVLFGPPGMQTPVVSIVALIQLIFNPCRYHMYFFFYVVK